MDKEGVLSPIMGEKGKDGEVALCILDGVEGDLSSPLEIYSPYRIGRFQVLRSGSALC
jgi:hypothetical protein